MNAIFFTFLKRLYRKERISSFLLVVGAVDALLGGVNEIGTLLIFGLLTSGAALGYRWWCIQQAEAAANRQPKQLYLPAADLRSPLDLDDRRRPPL
jgi:hypothetical protein